MIRSSIKATLKLLFCGAIIAMIGGLVLVLSPTAEVQDAQADLFDIVPSDLLQHRNFHRVMLDAGLEPEPYDHNGNLIYFAAGESEMSPRELMGHLQNALRQAGVNSENYLEPMFGTSMPNSEEELFEFLMSDSIGHMGPAMLLGEVVPLHVMDDHVSMAGIVPPQSFSDKEEMMAFYAENHHLRENFDNFISSYRYIDISSNPGGGSTITANWADGNFDPARVRDPSAVNVRPDLEVPPCIGCNRLNRFAALEGNRYVMNQFETTSPGFAVRDFYIEAMNNRGWELSKGDQIILQLEEMVPELQAIDGALLQFERDGEFVSFFIDENTTNHRTGVVSIQGQESRNEGGAR